MVWNPTGEILTRCGIEAQERKKKKTPRATKTWPMHQSKGKPLRQSDFSKVNLPPQEVRR